MKTKLPFSVVEQIPIGEGIPLQEPFTSQESGTSQIPIAIPVELHLSFADLIQRVAAIEDKIVRLDELFSTSIVTINTLGNNKWEFKRPLNVTVEQRGPDDFVACLYDVNLYGYGDSIPEALEDLKIIIVNQFEFLLQQEGELSLGNPLKKQFEFLKNILVDVNV